LIERLLGDIRVSPKSKVFDPFAGSGTSLFVASNLGATSVGIELLPIGLEIIKARMAVNDDLTPDDFNRLTVWADVRPWVNATSALEINELRITKGAYPPDTLDAIQRYLSCLRKENERVQSVLLFALLCVLEDVSFTRKDGQYLRWDYRSQRKQGARQFDKGIIKPFDEAITSKIREIVSDKHTPAEPELFEGPPAEKGAITLLGGSCLEQLPLMESNQFDVVVTSPPYCNRYDYTRTYALELALLGTSETALTQMRQTMLSCTVENRQKDLLALNKHWHAAIDAANKQELLQEILSYLESQKALGFLNNSGIPRMIRGYFYEMACVIQELFRTLQSGGKVIMINDNVRYAGAPISVDLILSEIAEKLGFTIEAILVLPTSKGNSSQQMGEHGRNALRKCIYIWKKN
jgi:DNA modification methylase